MWEENTNFYKGNIWDVKKVNVEFYNLLLLIRKVHIALKVKRILIKISYSKIILLDLYS